jgi:hypothetical protein
MVSQARRSVSVVFAVTGAKIVSCRYIRYLDCHRSHIFLEGSKGTTSRVLDGSVQHCMVGVGTLANVPLVIFALFALSVAA